MINSDGTLPVINFSSSNLGRKTQFSSNNRGTNYSFNGTRGGRQNNFNRGRNNFTMGSYNIRNWNNNSKPHCQICNRIGHTAMKCYSLHGPNFYKQISGISSSNYNNSSKTSETNSVQGQSSVGQSSCQAHMASTSNNENTSNWYPDSGSTNHITQDLTNLSFKNNYNCKDPNFK